MFHSHLNVPVADPTEFPEAIRFLLASKEAEVPTLYCVVPAARADQPRGLPISDQMQAGELSTLLPAREQADMLVNLYRENFEFCSRIIHFPTFLKRYAQLWEQPETTPSSFIASVLAICAVASAFAPQSALEGVGIKDTAVKWIDAVRAWLQKQDTMSQATIACMQVQCLLLLASGMKWIASENSWLSAGALMRMAIAAGLHRDPADFPKISPFWAEIRRRMWYTILELDLQLSFDHGRPQHFSADDFDCGLPANINDEKLEENMEQPPVPQSDSSLTDVSAQRLLAKSWALRNRVCRLSNKIVFDTPYETILKLDSELNGLLQEAKRVSGREANDCRKFFLDDQIYKAIIALHHTHTARATYDPRFLYSRQVTVETSVTVLSKALSSPHDAGGEEAPRLFDILANICRTNLAGSVQNLSRELLIQAKQYQSMADGTQPMATAQWNQGRQQILIDLVEKSIAAFRAVLGTDEKGHRISSWLHIATSLAKAVVHGEDPTKAMGDALKTSLHEYSMAMRGAPSQHLQNDQTLSVSTH